MSSSDDSEYEFQEAENWVKEHWPELWRVAQTAEKPGFVRRVLRKLPKKLHADFVRGFTIECRAGELGGIRVIMRNRLVTSKDPKAIAEANRWLREIDKEQHSTMATLSPNDRKEFVRNVWKGAKEAEEDLATGD